MLNKRVSYSPIEASIVLILKGDEIGLCNLYVVSPTNLEKILGSSPEPMQRRELGVRCWGYMWASRTRR